jgi:hypothetical protein
MRFPPALRVFMGLGALAAAPLVAQTPTPPPATTPPPAAVAAAPAGDSFYANSLHFTNRGIVYNYDRGLGRMTGLPANKLGCTAASCHVTSCDPCHKQEADGKAAYTVAQARSEKACAACHGEPDAKDVDVHVRKGMKCMACHTTREIHGDGTRYDSAWQPGAMDARCERCHQGRPKSASHTVHGDKLDCAACHTSESTTCFNCHIDSRLAGVKGASIKRDGLFFLVNHGGRVKLANVLTYVYGKATMITIAPSAPHKIGKAGRTCAECHGAATVRDAAAGTLEISRFSGGELTTTKGIIPVFDGMTWKVAFLGREGAKWVPLADAKPPEIVFSGFAMPLTRAQLAKIEKPMGKR